MWSFRWGRRGQARIIELVLAIALSIVVFTAYTLYMAQPIYSPGYEAHSLDRLARNIALRLQSDPGINAIIEGLFGGNRGAAETALAQTVRPMLPQGVYAVITFYPYEEDPATGMHVFSEADAVTVVVGQVSPTGTAEGSGKAVYTSPNLKTYLIVVKLFRVRR